jgi:enoyl-CoA hydratase/carnithine racemase
MSFETVLYEKRDAIALVTLSRPEVVNAFNVQMRDDLYEAIWAVRDDPGVRGVIIRGEGEGGFCAGADLKEFGSAPSQAVARSVRWERDLWGLILGTPKPIVAAIHGYCLGSGLEIACLCDMRIASEEAVFGMPETGLALIPAAGGTQMLPRIVGEGRAMELLLAGERFDAAAALRMGLVGEVVPRGRSFQRAIERMTIILEAPDAALRAAKRSVQDGADMTLGHGLAMERRMAQRVSLG